MQPRILILLDKSSSMTQSWEAGRQKAKVGNELILKLMDSVYSVNPEVEFSLRAFGHQYTVDEKNCRDTRNEVPFHKDNRQQMEYRLEDLQSLGVTSIAYSLQEAAINDLVDITHNTYSIVLVTDGGESCGGDICEVMRRLINNKVFFKPYIVSLEAVPGLRDAYSCMGDYLEVTHQGDIRKAVGAIVQAFTPVISLKTKELTKVNTVSASSPTMMGVTIPDVKITDTTRTITADIKRLVPAPHTIRVRAPLPTPLRMTEIPGLPEETGAPVPVAIAAIAPAAMTAMAVRPPMPATPSPVALPGFTPDVPEEHVPVTVVRMPVGLRTLAVTPKPMAPREFNYLPYASVKMVDLRPDPEYITRLFPTRLHTFGILYVVDENSAKFPYRKPPPMPPLKYDIPAPRVAPKPPVSGALPEGAKPIPFELELEDATETTVEVYFTDGHGKYFSSTPQIMLLDPKTNNMVKRFYRMVDADGNPDPQKGILPGFYNLTFTELRNLVSPNVEVVANKHNRITITVSKASLVFEYANNLDRPVSEFTATVIERNKANGRVQAQKCTDRLEYEPGNYFVDINTFPRDKRNLDLDFGEKVIKIPQPGFVKFVADPGIGSVVLYEQLGDKFLSFATVRLSDYTSQNLQIQPGMYQAHFRSGPGGPAASEKVVVFVVKATEVTQVELK